MTMSYGKSMRYRDGNSGLILKQRMLKREFLKGRDPRNADGWILKVLRVGLQKTLYQ